MIELSLSLQEARRFRNFFPITWYSYGRESVCSLNRVYLPSDLQNSCNKPVNWIAFDLEWESKAEAKGNQRRDTGNSSNVCNSASGTSVPPIGNEYQRIITFGYEDVFGNRNVLDISGFLKYPNPDKEFLSSVREKLVHYRYCFAWGSKATKHANKQTSMLEGVNGDLVILDMNLKRNGIPSIVKYDKFTGRPSIHQYGSDTADIDLCSVFAKPIIRHVIFKNKYKSLRLQEISTALLGYGRLGNESGSAILRMPINQRKAYCLHDAHLVAELVRVNNGNLLKVMDVIACHTGLSLAEVCEKGMTGIWTKILNEAVCRKADLVGYYGLPLVIRRLYSKSHKDFDYSQIEEDIEVPEEDLNEDVDTEANLYHDNASFLDGVRTTYQDYYSKSESQGIRARKSYKKYRGAIVPEASRGIHRDVSVFDVTSLYPTIIIKYNLSPETINCSCCKDDSKVNWHITSDISDECQYASNDGGYWICQRKKGLFAKILDTLTKERIKYKQNGLEIESQAIKAVINSGYGVFDHPFFKYYDPRVAELVTAFGRYILTSMQMIARKLGFVVLYGDTDSLFVNNIGSIDNAQKFISECQSNLGVTVGHERVFARLILTGKKHYIGILPGSDNEPVIKGMEGLKSDRPEFIHKVFLQLVDDIKYNRSPIRNLKEAIRDLEAKNVPSEELAISLVLHKNPEEYDQECKQSRIGKRLHLRRGMTLVYYKTRYEELDYQPVTARHQKRVRLESENPGDISYTKYREMLLTSVKGIVEILGYDVSQLSDAGRKRLKDSIYFKT